MAEFFDKYFISIKDLFYRLGLKSVTMDTICSNLGISKRTLYQHFKDKDELVRKIFYKDIYLFTENLKYAENRCSNAIDATFILFELISKKQGDISSVTLYDLKKYYNPLYFEITAFVNWSLTEIFIKVIKSGISEGNYRKDIDTVIISEFISSVLNPFEKRKFDNLKMSLYKFLDYHLNSICSEFGRGKWEELRREDFNRHNR